jgi:hypothetical protein
MKNRYSALLTCLSAYLLCKPLLITSFVIPLQTKAIARDPNLVALSAIQDNMTQAHCTHDPDDLFDYFDPLKSPHAYPDGISPNTKPLDPSQVTHEPARSDAKVFGFDLPNHTTKPSSLSREAAVATDRPRVDTNFVFDPTLSPHEYANGTPDLIIGEAGSSEYYSTTTPKTVGILLMDHGSRNQASNDRLHELAKLYQSTLLLTSNVIVRAAHMEIASPSIPEAIQDLLDEGVEEIVAHPYFLSPGRHVVEDIPEIIASAVRDLNVQIPVKTTDPVGSSTMLMIRAIDTLVKKTSSILNPRRQ